MHVLEPGAFEVLTFDCYGTLIDWETGILSALMPLLRAHGTAPAESDVLQLYARFESQAEAGEYRCYRDVLRLVTDAFGAHFRFTPTAPERLTLEHSLPHWQPFADTVPALAALGRQHRLAVISNVDDDLFTGTAARLGARFDPVITAQQVRAYKPDLELFHRALARLDTPPEKILHVAQSLHHDVAPATQLGLATVWVRRRQDLSGFGATPASSAVPTFDVPDLAMLARQLVS